MNEENKGDKYMNKVILARRTCTDWKTRKYGDNKSFVTNTLAISEGNDKTEFVSVTAFGKTAEVLYKYVKKGDIVFSRVGSVDRCSFVDPKHDGWMFSGRCLRVRPSEEVDSLFLYYFFCLNTTKEFVRSIAVGATMPSINTKLLGEVEVVCPEIEEQRKIADILSKIDDKIEENQKINENLAA